mgnify:CR=1 FL=1
MPIIADFKLDAGTDGILTINMSPPVNIQNWNIQFRATNRLGGVSGLIIKSCASGFNNVSGINVVNAGAGIFDVDIRAQDTSGFNQGAYAHIVQRLDSGLVNDLVKGYLLLE